MNETPVTHRQSVATPAGWRVLGRQSGVTPWHKCHLRRYDADRRVKDRGSQRPHVCVYVCMYMCVYMQQHQDFYAPAPAVKICRIRLQSHRHYRASPHPCRWRLHIDDICAYAIQYWAVVRICVSKRKLRICSLLSLIFLPLLVKWIKTFQVQTWICTWICTKSLQSFYYDASSSPLLRCLCVRCPCLSLLLCSLRSSSSRTPLSSGACFTPSLRLPSDTRFSLCSDSRCATNVYPC